MPNIAATNCQDSSKGFVTIADILQRSIHSFKAFSSHQWTLVPHNNSCVPKQSGSIRIFIEIAKVVIFYCEKNFESRVCSSSSCASYFSKDCFQQKSFSCASWRIYEYQSLSLCVIAISSLDQAEPSFFYTCLNSDLSQHRIPLFQQFLEPGISWRPNQFTSGASKICRIAYETCGVQIFFSLIQVARTDSSSRENLVFFYIYMDDDGLRMNEKWQVISWGKSVFRKN